MLRVAGGGPSPWVVYTVASAALVVAPQPINSNLH
jgi:hypothetical protein